MSELISVVKGGGSVADQVKESIQATAQAKQLLELKKQSTAKLCNVINALMQTYAIDPDNACTTALSYAAGLAQGSGTSKEDFLRGFEKIWTSMLAQQQEVKDEQIKMLLKVATGLMAHKQAIPPPLIAQMKALGCTISDELQKYIDSQSSAPADQATLRDVSAPAAEAN
jgi:hypothetical protein